MRRTIITPTDTRLDLLIPQDYVGKQIEITFLPLDELEPASIKITMDQFWGVLSDQTAEVLHQHVTNNREEW